MTALKPSRQSIATVPIVSGKDLSRQIWEAQGHADRAAESAAVTQGYSDLVTATVSRYSVRQDTNDSATTAAIGQSARIEAQFMNVRNTCVIWGGISGVVMAAIGSLLFTQAPKPQIIERVEVQLQPQYFTTKTAPKLKRVGG